MEELLHKTAQLIPRIITCDRSSVALIARDKPDHFVVFSLAGNRAIPIHMLIPLEGTATEHCIQLAETVSFPDLETSPWAEHGMLVAGGLRSTACAPLLSAGRVIGTLNIGSQQKHGFDPQAQRHLTLLALMLASHIDNHHSMEDVRRQISSMERLQNFSQQIANIAHSLKSPVAASLNEVGALAALSEELHQSAGHPEVTAEDLRDLSQDLKQHLDTLRVSLERAASFLHSLGQRTHHLQVHSRSEFVVQEELEEALGFLRGPLHSAGIRLQVHDLAPDATLYGDPGKFRQVLTHLVTNAMEAITEAQKGDQIHIYLDQARQGLELCVEDNGPGVPLAHQHRIFEALFTSRVEGTGLGLSLSRDILQALFQGSLHLEQEEDSTRFVARFPFHRSASANHLRRAFVPFPHSPE